MNSLSHYNLVHKFCSNASSIKNTGCKGCSGKRMGKNWRRYRHGSWRKSETKRSDRSTTEHGQKSSFCVIDGSLSSRELGVRASMSQVQRQSRTPRWHCERWFRIIRSIYWTRIISITDDCRKKHGHYFKTAGMRRTSSRCSIRQNPSEKWKMLTNYWKFQNRSVQTFGFVYHDTNGPNHGPVWKTQLFLLSEICTVILWQDYCGNGNFETVPLEHGREKVPNWECLFVNREEGLFLSV